MAEVPGNGGKGPTAILKRAFDLPSCPSLGLRHGFLVGLFIPNSRHEHTKYGWLVNRI
jgi:hypothetical protein